MWMASATRCGSAVSTGAGPAVRHRAIRARARADVAEDHEGRGAVVPALADVGAPRFLADGVQAEIAQQVLQPEIVRGSGSCAFAEPGGLGSRVRITDSGMSLATSSSII